LELASSTHGTRKGGPRSSGVSGIAESK